MPSEHMRKVDAQVDACPDRAAPDRCTRGRGADPAAPERVDRLRCYRCVTGQLEYETPGLIARAVSFAAAVASHVVEGMPSSSPEEKARRLTICRACDRHDDGTCRACGCILEVKAGWAEQSCPLDPPKWGPLAARTAND